MKSKNLLKASALLIIGVVFGAILVSNFGWVRPSLADVQIGTNQPPVQQIDPNAKAFNDAFVNVAEKVTPSIVQITTVSEVKNRIPDEFHFFFPFRDDVPRNQQGGGSGVIISEDGYILTNNHVVEDAVQVTVGLLDRREFEAKVVGTDPLTDLAVIKIDAEDLPAAYLGNSDELKVGQWVMAIGNPLALASTVTAGIVSAKGRNLGIIADSYRVENFIQTDAAINPGNSGGALVDLNGAVVGINSAIATNGMTKSYIGYGFAIPSNLAKSVSEDLIANGKVTRGYIGVSISPVDDAIAKAVGLDKPKGVLIQSIVENGSAADADIKPMDIIIKVDDREVNQPNELQSYVASKRAGEKVVLTLFRDGDMITRTVTLKSKDGNETAASSKETKKPEEKKEIEKKEISFDEIGFSVRNMSESELKSYKSDAGVLITKVEPYSKAFNQRLRATLVIVEADKSEISNVSELEDIINNKKGSAVLLKMVDKNGNSQFVGLEIPN
jgi:serine protease Do